MKKFLFALFALFACSMASSAENQFNDVIPYEAGKVSISMTLPKDALVEVWVLKDYWYNDVPIFTTKVFTKRMAKGDQIVQFDSEEWCTNDYRIRLFIYDSVSGDLLFTGWTRMIKDLNGNLLQVRL